MVNPQPTLLIVSITGAIGWVLAFMFYARWRWNKEKYRLLLADRKALKSSYCRVSNELKNLQHKAVEPFKERNRQTMPGTLPEPRAKTFAS